MNIYWCNPEKGRQWCDRPARFCGKYCTMTYTSAYSDDGKPLPLEVVEAENERIRKLYEADRKKETEMAAGGNEK